MLEAKLPLTRGTSSYNGSFPESWVRKRTLLPTGIISKPNSYCSQGVYFLFLLLIFSSNHILLDFNLLLLVISLGLA